MDELDIVVDLPVICTRGMVVFPSHEISLDVGRSFSLKAIELSVNEFDENVVFISQKIHLMKIQILIMFIIMEHYVRLKEELKEIIMEQLN